MINNSNDYQWAAPDRSPNATRKSQKIISNLTVTTISKFGAVELITRVNIVFLCMKRSRNEEKNPKCQGIYEYILYLSVCVWVNIVSRLRHFRPMRTINKQRGINVRLRACRHSKTQMRSAWCSMPRWSVIARRARPFRERAGRFSRKAPSACSDAPCLSHTRFALSVVDDDDINARPQPPKLNNAGRSECAWLIIRSTFRSFSLFQRR